MKTVTRVWEFKSPLALLTDTMSRPPLNPAKTTAGIAVDPQTLERVIPESKRPDGTYVSSLSLDFSIPSVYLPRSSRPSTQCQETDQDPTWIYSSGRCQPFSWHKAVTDGRQYSAQGTYHRMGTSI